MTKQIVIEISDDKYLDYSEVIDEVLTALSYIEANVQIQEV